MLGAPATREGDLQRLSARIGQLARATGIPTVGADVQDILDVLQIDNATECSQLDGRVTQVKQELQTSADIHAHATSQLKTLARDRATLDAVRAHQDVAMRSLESDITLQCACIEEHQLQIERERQRRHNAIYDLIPFHGLMAAFKTGDATRVIPYYSQLRGIVSALGRRKEAAEERLRRTQREISELTEQAEQTERALAETEREIEQLKTEAAVAADRIAKCNRDSKLLGRRLCELHESRSALHRLQSEYTLLQCDVALARALDEPIQFEHIVGASLEDEEEKHDWIIRTRTHQI